MSYCKDETIEPGLSQDTKDVSVIGLPPLQPVITAIPYQATGSGGYARRTPASEEASTDEEDEALRLSTPRMVLLAMSIIVIFFVGSASAASVTLLIPSIARSLGETEIKTQWVASAYTLAFACGLLFAGRLADLYGRRLLYLGGIATYVVFAILTGVLRNLIGLSVTRAMSGLGLAIASPAGFGIIGVNIRHEPARTIVFALFGLGNPVGAAFGTLIGGIMASLGATGWSYLFFLLAGLALIPLVAGYFIVPLDRKGPAADKRIDWVGGFLCTAAICLFTFSLTESGIAQGGWASPHVPALFVTSLVLLMAFILWSLHLEHRTSYPPVIKMSLITRRQGLIGITCLCCFFQILSVQNWVYATTIFYQVYKGVTPLQNSISTLTSTIVGIGAASGVMFLAPRVATPHLIGIGAVCTGTGSILYAVWPEGISFWKMEFPAQFLIPWGIDFAFGLGNILISNLVDQDEQSIGGALFQTFSQVGGALGICLGSLITTRIEQQQNSVLAGVRAAMWFGAACGLSVTFIAYIGFRKVKLAKDVGKIA